MKWSLFVGLALGLAVTVLALCLSLQSTPHTQEFTPYNSPHKDDAFTLDEVIGSDFRAKYFNGSWWSDTELQWEDQVGNLVTWDLTTNKTTVLVSADLISSNFTESGVQFKGFSPDAQLLLFAVDVNPVWRHSYTARYIIFNPTSNTTQTVQGNNTDILQFCHWVENKDDNNTLAIVYGNNLYWRLDAANDWEDDIKLSSDGLADRVFWGIPDWVYEEEVLQTNTAHYINQEGTRVAFARFDDTRVPEFRYPHYGDPANVSGWQYPEYRVVRYPKAGEVNPTVSLHVRTFTEQSNKFVVAPVEVQSWGEFIYTVAAWTQEDVLSITWMNRIQNESVISECREQMKNWKCSSIFQQKQSHGWIEIASPPVYGKKGFLHILPSKQPSGHHYKHVALQSPDGGSMFLSQGNFVVTEILSWQEDENIVYFMGTDEEDPGARHLYTVTSDGSQKLECVTCSIKTSRGELCQKNDVEFNWENSYYVHTCLGQVLPEAVLRKTSDNSIVFVFETNEDLSKRLQGKTLPTRVDTWVELQGGFRAPVVIRLPPHMDENVKYPLLVYVYGGPGSQMVSDSWKVDWGTYLVTNRNVVYASIDGRGTGGQSDEFLHQVYRRLGSVEIHDQIDVTRKLLESYSFLDPARTAIWGWSYGGFATAMTLEQDSNNIFSCGVSVAPVTSWLLYDSIYTERYMAMPQENIGGYNNSVINGMEGLRNKTWMLNHGVADDNVHYQHSMLLTKALERADIQFTQHSYPDENHGLGGVSRFLYHAMDNFWSQCFNIAERD